MKKSTGMMLGTVGAAAIVLAACGGAEANSEEQVIIYSNADDEAISVLKRLLFKSSFVNRKTTVM